MRMALSVLLLAGIPAAVIAAEEARIPASFFRLTSATVLTGKAPDWDYLTYEPSRQLLLIGRRDAGLWVFDARAHRVTHKIAKSEGAGASLLISKLDRGFTTNEDGSTTVFKLSTFATVARVKFADDADSGAYDAATGEIGFMSGDSQKLTFIDAKSLKITGTMAMPSKKLESPSANGAGKLYIVERDRNMLAEIDVRTKTVTHEWPTIGCAQPTGMALDVTRHRAFIGCRGAKPVLAVMDTQDGHVVTTLNLGRGNDGVVYDAAHHRIFTTNGVDSNMVVYHQDDTDHYRMEQAVTTRPGARTLAFDPIGQRVFIVTAEGVVDPAKPINTGPSPFYANAFYDNSFVVLTYAASRQ